MYDIIVFFFLKFGIINVIIFGKNFSIVMINGFLDILWKIIETAVYK